MEGKGNEMIKWLVKGELLQSVIKSSLSFPKENIWRSVGGICMGILGLKVLQWPKCTLYAFWFKPQTKFATLNENAVWGLKILSCKIWGNNFYIKFSYKKSLVL